MRPFSSRKKNSPPVEHELGRAGARRSRSRARSATAASLIARAQLGVERRRRRLLEHLLVAPLHRALALAERERRAVRVGEQLDLDVARPLEVALEEDAVVAEAGLRLAPRRLERVVELLGACARRACRGRRRRRPPSRSAGSRAPPGRRRRRPARPPRAAIRFASSLSPPRRSASGGGPTHVSPAASTASAKSALSARKP